MPSRCVEISAAVLAQNPGTCPTTSGPTRNQLYAFAFPINLKKSVIVRGGGEQMQSLTHYLKASMKNKLI